MFLENLLLTKKEHTLVQENSAGVMTRGSYPQGYWKAGDDYGPGDSETPPGKVPRMHAVGWRT